MRSIIPISLAISRALFFALLLSIALYAMAKPARPEPAKEKPVPNIAGESRWGTIEQAPGSRTVKIDGDPH